MQEQEKKKTRGTAKNAAKNGVQKSETMQSIEEKAETSAQGENNNPENAVFTMEQVQRMIEEAIAKSKAEQQQDKPLTSVTSDEFVTMIFQAEVNDSNTIPLGANGKFGYITGKKATITIHKRDFMGEFRTSTIQGLLKSRNLIVVNGLTEEERKIYGLDYKEGEYLEPQVYDRVLEMGDDILTVYPMLHESWRKMIAIKCAEAFENKTLKLSRETLVQLNKISRKDYANLPKTDERSKGAFYAIIRAMNAADENGEE